jgi:hypothetical protein
MPVSNPVVMAIVWFVGAPLIIIAFRLFVFVELVPWIGDS